MPRIFSISSVYARDKSKEEKNNKRITEWFLSDDTAKLFEPMGFKQEDILPPDIASKDDGWEIVSAEGVRYPYSNMVAKGVAVRNKLLRIKTRYAYTMKDDDIIVYFDGDGQISFPDIVKMIEKLKTENYAIAKRTNGCGIDDERAIVEQFENFLVSQKFSQELLDAQCGLWGFKARFLNELWHNLSAEGFEIELDVLIYFLSKGINPSYIECHVNNTEDTTFTPSDDNWKKLVYILKKFQWTYPNLLDMIQKFPLEKSFNLPKSYIELISSRPEIINLH